jgi:iron-sulfur cluster repair protein YtfE (RIC family)
MGPISGLFADDHRRLEALLDRATAGSGPIDRELFEQFRAGLLRHIGMEEKVLFPAAQRATGGQRPRTARCVQ